MAVASSDREAALRSSAWTRHSSSGPSFRRSFSISAVPTRRSAARRPESRNCSFGVLTSLLSSFRCHARIRRIRNMCSSRTSQRSTVLPSTPSCESEAGQVEQPARRSGRVVDQATHFVVLAHRGDLRDVAFGERACVGEQPVPAAAPERCGKGPRGNRRIRLSSMRSGVGPVRARFGKSAAKARSRNSGTREPAISAREKGRSSIVSTRPASESGEIRASENIDRAGDQVASRSGIFIDRLLEREDETGRALNFVDHRDPLATDETRGNRLRRNV